VPAVTDRATNSTSAKDIIIAFLRTAVAPFFCPQPMMRIKYSSAVKKQFYDTSFLLFQELCKPLVLRYLLQSRTVLRIHLLGELHTI